MFFGGTLKHFELESAPFAVNANTCSCSTRKIAAKHKGDFTGMPFFFEEESSATRRQFELS